jgi:hypothetical protein
MLDRDIGPVPLQILSDKSPVAMVGFIFTAKKGATDSDCDGGRDRYGPVACLRILSNPRL